MGEPEAKRKTIGREFIRSFEAAQREMVERIEGDGEEAKFLVQGTLHPDVAESGGGTGTARIKSRHNVDGLPEEMDFELAEPLRARSRMTCMLSATSRACRRIPWPASPSRAQA